MNIHAESLDEILERCQLRASLDGAWWNAQLRTALSALPTTEFAQLADLLCDHFRARDRVRRNADAALPDFTALLATAPDSASFCAQLAQVEIHLVFTSHPSELRPPAVLDAFRSLPPDASIAEVAQALAPLPKIRLERPTVEDEIAAMVAFFKETLFPAYLAHRRALRTAVRARFGVLATPLPPAFIFATWAGGDRDGNPFVTAARTRAAGDALHAAALTQLQAAHAQVVAAGCDAAAADRLAAWLDARVPPSSSHADALEQLASLIRDCGEQMPNNAALHASLLDIYDIFAVCGTHGAALEWRENAEIIVRAFAETNGARDCQRPDLAPDVADCLASLRELAALRERHGERAVDALIISNCEDAATVLALESLARACGVFTRGPISIVPLLESIQALQSAPSIVGALCASPIMAAHARAVGALEIMVGYSDAAKDGGRMMADHAIRTAQHDIAEVCKAHGLQARIFHGRGGSPARGWAEIADIIDDADPLLAPHKRKFTEQGEVLANRYGNRLQAERTLGTALLAAMADNRVQPLSAADAQRFTRLAADAYAIFHSVRSDPQFLTHLLALTPLADVCLMPLGSRPSARAGSAGTITLNRLRAIPLNLATNLALLQIPAWLGTGTAWSRLLAEEGHESVAAFVRRSVYAQLSLARAAHALGLSDIGEITRRANLPEFAAQHGVLAAAADDAMALQHVLSVLNITGVAQPRADAQWVLLRAMLSLAPGTAEDSAADETISPSPARFTLFSAMAAALGMSG